MESASTAASAGALLLAGEWPRRTQRRGTNGPHGIEQKRPPGTGIRLAWLKFNKGATTWTLSSWAYDDAGGLGEHGRRLANPPGRRTS